MRRLRIILLVIGVILLLLVAAGAFVVNKWTRGPLPQHVGELVVEGLNDTVRILRDTWGVPHIYASNIYDLFFAQGYTHAQDRWWQMEFSRHVGQGRIQELTGRNRGALSNDIGLRTMGWYRTALYEVENVYDDEILAILQAFSDGVNAYIFSRDPGELALEYNILGLTGVKFEIEPWTPAHSVVWAKAMAWDLRNDGAEMARSEMLAVLDEEMTAIFFPPWPHGQKPTMILPEDLPLTEASLGQAPVQEVAGVAGLRDSFAGGMDTSQSFAVGHGEGIGSNNWVVSGDLTASGRPLLANDMHLGLNMPSIWYEIGLHCVPVSEECPFNVRGFQFALIPMIVAGHNDYIAWGHTDHTDDVVDYYLIRVNPENELQYEWNGEWRDMTVHEEVIRFGNSDETITILVRETHLGPIINDNEIGEDGSILGFNNEDPRAMRWTALDPGQIATAVMKLNLASNWEEFRAALAYWNVPSQNIVYADIEGNIGMQNPGQIPVRAPGHSGLLPMPGWTDEYEWLGFIPYDSLPRVYNPARGYIQTANQATVPLEYFELLNAELADTFGADANYVYAYHWDYGYRGERIAELLEALVPHDADTFATILGDNKLISAEEVMPYLAALELEGELAGARDWLLEWDYQLHMDSPHAALYMHFWASLMDHLFNNTLGELGPVTGGAQQMWVTYLLLNEPENPWWDDPATDDVVETRDEILLRAFAEGHSNAVTALGNDRAAWRWGSMHTLLFVSNPLGLSGIDPVESMVNRGPFPVSGGTATVNAASFNLRQGSFAITSGTSERVIYDVGDWAQSLSIHTTGQSGHPFSPHYDDMIDPWRLNEYKPMLWTPEQVEAAAVSVLVLRPPR